MKARVGDFLVRNGDNERGVCEIVGLHHADGSPPYAVRWLSDGHIALLYPGPYTRLVRRPAGPRDGRAAGGPARSQTTESQPADGKARPARAPGRVRFWQGNPFTSRSLAARWPAVSP
jgi:hypothetical protein